MRLTFRAGTEAHAGDAAAALDGHAVRGKGPFVDEGTAGAFFHGGHSADAFRSEHGLVRLSHSPHMRCGLGIDPRGEVALGGVDETSPGRTFVCVHGYGHVVGVLLTGRQITDLLEAGLEGLARRHASVEAHGAGVRHRAARGGGKEDLADRDGAASEEIGVLALRVELRIEHFDKALDRRLFGGVVLIERTDVL